MTDNNPKTVQEAWSAVMADVQALGKNQAVTSGPARFNFRGVDDVMNAVGPALRTHGVSVIPVQVHSTSENVVTKSGAHMRNVTVFVQYAINGPDGSTMPGAAAGEAADAGDKATPKAMSVAFRTFLLQALCLPTNEPDPDQHQYERAAQDRLTSFDWGALLDQVAATTTDEELKALWYAENIGNAPQWVQDKATGHREFLQREQGSGLQPIGSPNSKDSQ